MMPPLNTTIFDQSSLLQDMLKHLRDKNTPPREFRRYLRTAGYWLTYEILSRDMDLVQPAGKTVETPLGKKPYTEMMNNVVQVMIMRAGQPFCEGGTRLLEATSLEHAIGTVDAKRIEVPGSLDFKYEFGSFKVPPVDSDTLLIIYDPMLATGGTLIETLNRLKERGEPKRILSAHIIAARHGLERLFKKHPDVIAYTIGLNEEGRNGLDRNGFIYGDLGDCGDRAFGKYD